MQNNQQTKLVRLFLKSWASGRSYQRASPKVANSVEDFAANLGGLPLDRAKPSMMKESSLRQISKTGLKKNSLPWKESAQLPLRNWRKTASSSSNLSCALHFRQNLATIEPLEVFWIPHFTESGGAEKSINVSKLVANGWKIEIKVSFVLKTRVAGSARNWVVPRINTFVPVM